MRSPSWPWLLLLCSLLLSVLLCGLVDRLARRQGWLDMPSPRRVHKTPLPRLGGVGMALAFLPLAAIIGERALPPNFLPEMRWGLLGALLITAFMVLDDLRDLSPLAKLIAQFAAAAIPVAAGLRIDHVSTPLNNPFSPNPLASPIALPPLVAIVVTLLWFAGMMNAVNALDGIDGLAGGVVAIAAAALALHTALYMQVELGVAFLMALLAAVCIGFLWWNWPPARLIMGDSGSNFLGYTLAMLSILGAARLATALLVLGIPILDFAYVIWMRRRTGHGAMHFDLGHLHHRLLKAGLTTPAILGLLYSLTALAGVAALFLEKTQKLFGFAVLIVLAFLVIVSLPRRLTRGPGAGGRGKDTAGSQRPGGPGTVQSTLSPDP
jgi:UDP-N-acetylmuramyl pentapeptide phosphotransferase/UDP-N-acetylglucosamine-1-phosphate transferase